MKFSKFRVSKLVRPGYSKIGLTSTPYNSAIAQAHHSIARQITSNPIHLSSRRSICVCAVHHTSPARSASAARIRPQHKGSPCSLYYFQRFIGPQNPTQARTMASTASLKVAMAGDLVESAKKAAAIKAVEEHFSNDFKYVGIGSGSTIKYVVEAIAALPKDVTKKMKFVPTGAQSLGLIRTAELTPMSIDYMVDECPYNAEQQYLDVCFDGADEVDLDLNLIKGGGACLYQEKLVAVSAKKFVCVADYRKKVDRLLTDWVGIPIEVHPLAGERVRRELIAMGSSNPVVRQGLPSKAGPMVTDNGMWIIDAPFKPLLLARDTEGGKKGNGEDGVWSVDALALKLKSIDGIFAIGIFSGSNGPVAKATGSSVVKGQSVSGGQKPIAVYFGLKDGSVESIKA